jgi:hypothetical protein
MSLRLLTSLAFLIFTLFGGSEVNSQPTSTFADDSPLEFRLTAPFGELGRDPTDRPEHPAVLEYQDPDGDTVALDIQIRIRGNSRVRECRYPPLSLNFRRRDTAGTEFAGQDRLKLVTLCRGSRLYGGYLATEFLIYRMFNLLTDRSFRVRWANVEYLDTSARKPEPRMAPAFLIEADWEVAERLDLDQIETERVELGTHDPAHTALLTVFQYLIGNTDWSLFDGSPGEDCCHNGKAVGNPEGPVYVIPYDFDNAGLINAEYAVPSEILPIRRVTTRLYRGLCRLNAEVGVALDELGRQQDRLIAIFDSDVIDENARERAVRFIEGSFEVINDPDERQAEIYERCR